MKAFKLTVVEDVYLNEGGFHNWVIKTERKFFHGSY